MKNGSIAKQEERGNLKIKNKNMDIINKYSALIV